MVLDVVPTGGLNTSELLEKLQTPPPASSSSSSGSSSPTLTPSSPSMPRAVNINECASAISKDGSLVVIGKYSLLLLFKIGGNWKISRLVEDESQRQPGEYVTQLTILPLNKASNPYCIVAGYSSGFIRLFGVTGVQYVAQKFHHGPVRKLVVCTGGMIDVGLLVLYDGGVIVSLTNFNLPDPTSSPSSSSEAPPSPSLQGPASTSISYRKWHLFGMEQVNDLLFVSPPGAPAAGRVIAAGRNPAVSFYTVTEEQNSSLSVAVALASTVASKLTSAVVSLAKNWWWGSSSGEIEQNEKEKAKEKERDQAANEPTVSLSVRWGINDPTRQINSILEAPNTSIAAATDGFGRVLLVDTKACVITRMWKGYRDAQCGWIVIGKALYLVIHAPRRGIVEVWKMRHGSRVSVQSIGTGWRLIPALDNCYIMDKNGLVHQLVLRDENK